MTGINLWRVVVFTGLTIVGLGVVLAGRAGDDEVPSVGELAAAPAPSPLRGPVPEPTPAPTSIPTPTSARPTPSTESADTLRSIDELPLSGSGELDYADEAGVTYGAAPYLRFSVAVEEGIGVDADDVAAFVDETLADRRSWTGDGTTGFERIAEGGTFTLVVASPGTVDRLCRPLATGGTLSCGANGYVALNLLRWETATEDWPAGLDAYRRYLVNHEVGHYLLGPGHVSCPAPGEVAPLMMQQTKGLDGCLANGWPYPENG